MRLFNLGYLGLATVLGILSTGCCCPMVCGPRGVGSQCCDGGDCQGCGERYYDPWINEPADCSDPCDSCGNYNGQSCGSCRPMFSGIATLWGYRYGDGCGCETACDQACESSCDSPPRVATRRSCECEAPTCGCESPTCGCEAPTCGCESPTCGCEAPTCGCESPTCGFETVETLVPEMMPPKKTIEAELPKPRAKKSMDNALIERRIPSPSRPLFYKRGTIAHRKGSVRRR